MSLINRLLQRISGQSRHYRARRHTAYSPFGIQAAQVQVLENRRLLSALTVTTAADSGAGSLRAEIAAAKSGDIINFASSLKGQTITLTSGELLVNKGLTIQGPGAAQLTISGGNHSRVFDVASSQPVVLTGLTISNGASQVGGGIYDASGSVLTVSACTISNCHAEVLNGGCGGGIYNSGTLTLGGCTISGDSARLSGRGGGIFNAGQMSASNCTLSGDSATFGGGIYEFSRHKAWLTNCTIAGCSAVAGGGVNVGPYTIVSLTNCTVSLNHANGVIPGSGGGGITVASGYTAILYLNNTIVAGNTFGGSPLFTGADISGQVYNAYHDLVGNGRGWNIVNGSNGNVVGSGTHVINAMLGPLQNNGGLTMTMALLAGSPAIGQADNFFDAPVTDQRGVTRSDVPGELTDIGAFEV
jgi:hypothetical protein